MQDYWHTTTVMILVQIKTNLLLLIVDSDLTRCSTAAQRESSTASGRFGVLPLAGSNQEKPQESSQHTPDGQAESVRCIEAKYMYLTGAP